MAPHGFSWSNNISKPPKLSSDHLQRTISDISFELTTKEVIDELKLAPISEVEDAKWKFVCGLCAEAVKEELEKNGGKKEEALSAHMSACARFNKYGRAFPVLFQAQAMKEMLKKSTQDGKVRAKSISPRDKGGVKERRNCS
ncbi:hypothetical protein RIF29_28855 [Crotalaria pallida]|uniref:Uncharacterized protein n=1 Tax=Crotalaria pallida TaxID=3830 RepID=A0AAN9HWX3_CROPI